MGLNKYAKNRYFYLISDFRGKTFNFFTTEYSVSLEFIINGFYYVEIWPLYTNFVETFHQGWAMFCQMFFPESMEMIM